MRSFIALVALASIAFECVLGIRSVGLRGPPIGILRPRIPPNMATKGPPAHPSHTTPPLKAQSSARVGASNKNAAPTSIKDSRNGAPASKPMRKNQSGNKRKKKNGSEDDKVYTGDDSEDDKVYTGDDPEDEESDDLYEDTEEEVEEKPKPIFDAVIEGAQKEGTELTEDSYAIDKEKIQALANEKKN
ncbi:hypothetical protein DSO57_1036814 [Entomophthora muscae]|uniref:Uncharacterized protein n=3 Tax=Entomophthora muscae TaxID=34485 RepID=A0ACC2SBW5_9FUNG|nr:hypothetical protein DSO57_1029650 [Entomophthora muscae]KAJ9059888.1 hypothetical protein DSO57_1036813 [Entomophthora muscae]KAJ9059889.1 hypothetical protein DSO57_1036814 [Entomophthora muscae]